MPNIIVVGDPDSSSRYLEKYIVKHKIAPYEIEKFTEKIKIDEARNIKKSLSFKTNGQKLFVLSGDFTIGCQNALLKSIEESGNNIHFLFFVLKLEDLLPTILSRCQVTNLLSKSGEDEELCHLIEQLNEKNIWSNLDKIVDYAGKDADKLLPSLRFLLLQNLHSHDEARRYFSYCKKLISLTPLAENNNVNERVIFEKVFSSTSEAKFM